MVLFIFSLDRQVVCFSAPLTKTMLLFFPGGSLPGVPLPYSSAPHSTPTGSSTGTDGNTFNMSPSHSDTPRAKRAGAYYLSRLTEKPLPSSLPCSNT